MTTSAVAPGTRPKVIGLGLNKTGTSTLGICLRRLGYSHHGYARTLLAAFRQGNPQPALDLARRFEALEDWPWPLMYRELFDEFGSGARYVLTVRRSPQAWLDSLKRHSLRTPPDHHARKLAYGYDYPHGHEAEHIAFYEQHNAAVRAFFAGRDDIFLEVCWEAGDGWDVLCRFLGQPTPAEPFPHANAGRAAEDRADAQYRAINEARIAAQLAGNAPEC